MTTSIRKTSKSFFIKLLVGIIILPFVFWGMGDVFRGGNQNVIATIESKNVSTQEFMSYLNMMNLNKEQIQNLSQTDLVEKILSGYIGRKVMAMEIEKQGIIINDNSLRDIIKNDKLFFKNEKFSRTEYEKFLLKSAVSSQIFETNIIEQESRRQLLSSLVGGIVIPEKLIEDAFKKENQIKTIKYIDLETFYSNKKPSKEKIKEVYERNKKFFLEEFRSFVYAEITPYILTSNDEYSELFFKKLDILENKILDGQTFEKTIEENNLKQFKINELNLNKKNKSNGNVKNISNNLLEKIFTIKNVKNPEIIKIENKYFLVEVKLINSNIKPITDPEVSKAINSQINFQTKIENNTSLLKDISMESFDETRLLKFASENNLFLKNYQVSNLKQNDIFSEGIIKRIFATKDGKVDLITNSTLTKNFLILVTKTQYKQIDKSSNDFEKYTAKARLNLVNEIYKIFDDQLNEKYKVELNQKTIERVKNSF